MPKAALKDGRTQVRVSNAGQVSIPKPFRDAMGLQQGTVLEVEQVKGQLVFTPKVLTDWEGRRAYTEAKAAARKGQLKGPFDAKQADAYLAALTAKAAPKKARKR
jgi:AbrB family looped-hinge helix DNA binding protein